MNKAPQTHSDARPSRRGVLAGLAAGSAAATLGVSTADAALDPAGNEDGTEKLDFKLVLPKVRPYRATAVPDVATRHMANRFAYGYTPELGRQIKAAGGPQRWFKRQLRPNNLADAVATAYDSWFPTRHRDPRTSFALAERTPGYAADCIANHGRYHILRRAYSNRQLLEVMTEFWLNHLHISGSADLCWLYRADYDKTIAQHALGRFDEMLQAAIIHPAMLAYLDADLSRVDRGEEELNENLGREVLELHTVGREAGYTEEMVKDSARLLTGYNIGRLTTWEYNYDPTRHYKGQITVLGFDDPNTAADGRPALQRYLNYLAHHPATALRIARKLAVRFVSDDPSPGLVEHLTQVFTDSGTNITKTLEALVAHPEFTASVGKKVKTPTEDVVATLRAYGVKIKRPVRPTDAANVLFYLCRITGQLPFGWGPPNGFPDNAAAWSSAARMMGSYHIHSSLAGGYYPNTGVTYRPRASWLPQKRLRFDEFVDHLCRTLHGRGSTSVVLGAAMLATGVKANELITASHPLIQYRLPKLLGILLDTPQFMTR